MGVLRPKTLLLSLSGVILAAFVAYRDFLFFDFYIILFACVCVCLLQILSNLANDYGDGLKNTDLDRRGPKRFVQSGLIKVNNMKFFLIIFSIFTAIICFSYLYIVFNSVNIAYIVLFYILVIISILSAIFYTVGKNAYGYRGLGDIFVFLFFGLLNVMGSYFTFTKNINFYLLLPAVSLGLFCVSVLNVNNIRDYRTDKAANKNTIVVYLGVDKARYYQSLLISIAFILLFVYVFLDGFYLSELLFIILILPAFYHIKNIFSKRDNKLNKELIRIVLITFFVSVLFGLGQVLNLIQ